MTGPLYIVKVGDALPSAQAGRGDYDRWFAGATGMPPEDVSVVDPRGGDALPPLEGAGGFIVTGSSALVTDRAGWSERAGRWLVEAAGSGLPLLAVCYGHQLLADALGGLVGHNPAGREIGTAEVTLNDASREDALFSGLPSRLFVQATHRQSVLELPPGAQRLAGNAHDSNQAYRIGERCWCVQFHPEMSSEIIGHYVRGRRDELLAEGLDPDALLNARREEGHGRLLLERFGAIVRGERSRSA